MHDRAVADLAVKPSLYWAMLHPGDLAVDVKWLYEVRPREDAYPPEWFFVGAGQCDMHRRVRPRLGPDLIGLYFEDLALCTRLHQYLLRTWHDFCSTCSAERNGTQYLYVSFSQPHQTAVGLLM